MFETFTLPYVQRGLLEILLLSVGAGVIGTWIVLRGLAFFAHAVSTATFPGLVLADGLGFAATLGAGATGAAVAVTVGLLARRPGSRERYDSLTALVLVGALALGVILASDVFGSGAGVEGLLFGSLLLVDGGDLVLAGCASAVAVAAALALEQRWMIAGFDSETARALGARTALPDAVLLAVIALLAVAALATLGSLLPIALLVVPAATTRLFCVRLRAWQLATIALAAVVGAAGLWLSVQTNAPPGATIAVMSAGAFALAAAGRAMPPITRARRPAAVGAVLAALALVGSGCGGEEPASTNGGDASSTGAAPIEVVATTTVLGDLVRQVGGGAAEVTQILPPNADAHDYEPRPRDISQTAEAKLVVQSGDNLDRWIGDVVEQSGTDAPVVDVSEKLKHRIPGETEGEEASMYDPHWWHDPRNAMAAVGEIHDALVKANPGAEATYRRNADAYLAKLTTLDAGIERCFAKVPEDRRKLVSDHDAFGYFTDRYDITPVGAVIPSQTTQAQASAGDVAALAKVIRREGVKAIFPESSVSSKVAEAIARETGASAEYELYGDSLGADGSSGDTYLGMLQANADAMVSGFTGGVESCRIAGL